MENSPAMPSTPAASSSAPTPAASSPAPTPAASSPAPKGVRFADEPSVVAAPAPPSADAPTQLPVAASQSTPAAASPPAAPAPAAAAAAAAAATATEPSRRAAALSLARQSGAAQSQAVHAIAHRAAVDMEAWRSTTGAAQEAELVIYWGVWCEAMERAGASNAHVLACVRSFAAATAAFAQAVTAAGDHARLAASGAGLSSSAPGAVAAGAAPAAAALHGRSALSMPVAATALGELHAQLQGSLLDAAGATSHKVAGDADGPTGRHASRRATTRAEIDFAVPPPRDLAGLTSWFDAAVAELRRDGDQLAETLNEGGDLAARAFADFEAQTRLFLGGDAASAKKGAAKKDLWLAELRYRRVMRGLLGVKSRYMSAMATLFERYRRIEVHRSEALATAVDTYATGLAKLFDRVSAKAVLEAVKALNTHADFCRVVEEESRARILRMRAASAASSAAAAGGGSGSGAAASRQAAGSMRGSSSHIHFTIEALPAVVTPFASPLVLRCGVLFHQAGLMKRWTKAVGVLTRDAQLHLFSLEEDLATHPDVLAAIFPLADAATNASGHSQSVASAAGAAAGAAEGAAPPGVNANVPRPALPPDLMQLAVAYAARLDPPEPAGAERPSAATAPGGLEDPLLSKMRRAGAAPTQSFELTGTTKLAFAPAVHAHAFLLADKSSGGWFSTARELIVRAMNAHDALDWQLALSASVDTLSAAAAMQ